MGCLLAVNTGLGGFSGPIGGIASLAYTERSATANANGTLNVRSGPEMCIRDSPGDRPFPEVRRGAGKSQGPPGFEKLLLF